MPFFYQARNRIFSMTTTTLLIIATLSLLLLGTPSFAQDDDDPTSSTDQVSTSFVDPITSLTMQRFFGARTQFSFAMALPQTRPSSSFIGQLSFPLSAAASGSGWGALGLTGDMDGNFILAAWPDSTAPGGVMSSFRQATDEDNPPEVVGNFKARPIEMPGAVGVGADGVLTYTFLCEECLNASLGLGPEAVGVNGGQAVMGWALSERGPQDGEGAGARLGFHERGFGPFTMDLGAAGAQGFEGVAARAGLPVGASARAVQAVPGAFEAGSGGSGDEGGGGAVGGVGGGAGGGGGGGFESDSDDDD